MKDFASFSKENKVFTANDNNESEVKLPPGAYRFHIDQMRGTFHFTSKTFTHDALIDLPTKEYKEISNQMEHFMKEETRAKFKAFGDVYKFSALLHGLPGTGKTCIINRVCEYAHTKKGAITLFDPDPRILEKALSCIRDVQPETLVVVVWEEFDKWLEGGFETYFLNALDGEVQQDNVIYLATTNYIDKIPARVNRPGRFSRTLEVGFPDAASRAFYLEHKVGKDYPSIGKIVESTEGFSIDELHAVVRDVEYFGDSVADSVARIRAPKVKEKNKAYVEGNGGEE